MDLEGRSPCCVPRQEPRGLPLSTAGIVSCGCKVSHFAANLIQLPGGRFLMGTDSPERWEADGEGPVREVELSPFSIDAATVSNDEFAAFVRDSGYVTEAECIGSSFVFWKQLPKAWQRRGLPGRSMPGADWWILVKGASWKHPEGPGSDLRGKNDHPVVHISWNDAAAFARWAGKRLPTEAEWEYAARGGLEQKLYPWGDELTPGGKHRCNIWQGKFPDENRPEDGHLWTAPVRSYEPNGFGLYQTSGNVWEWCSDFWGTRWPAGPLRNPRGASFGEERVIRGGSFLCHASYCNRYRVAARTRITPDSATSHCGFRCAAD
ncbi:MAG: formylglycine-generating enzyme family protein [Verrucomicrobia bacterium]|nr:formylglycine-generating enzyme family protein [Verrucomicrobiota bacterium]